MKNASEAILKLLKDKVGSRCQKDKKREDAEQKPLSMTPCFGKGFTLIELLVVVLIIGTLSAVALPQYTKAVEKSRLAEILVVSRAIENAEKVYFMEHGEYSYNFEDLVISLPAGGNKTADNSYEYPDKASYTLYEEGGSRLDVTMKTTGLTFQTLFDPDFNQCVTSSTEKRKKLTAYLCESLGGVKSSQTSDGGIIYHVPK